MNFKHLAPMSHLEDCNPGGTTRCGRVKQGNQIMKPTGLPLPLSVALIVLLATSLQAQPTAHYCPGSEGLLGASVPPPGWYVRDYNVFYTADTLNNSSGQSIGPANFKAITYAQVPRIIWMSNWKFLGGDVGVSALLPLVYQNLTAGLYRHSTFGVGDFFLDSPVAWHTKQFDFVVAPGFWAPTGDSSAPPTTDAGLGYWGGMLTFGATWHMDTAKTWALSILNRYEVNGEQRDTHITPGNAWTLEWGLSKSLWKNIEVGPAGYFQMQTTADSGPAATSHRDRVAAVGPEIAGVVPKVEVNVSLRYLYECVADNRAQGQTITLTLTKRF